MELSHNDKTQSTKLIDLPLEILCLIFDQLQEASFKRHDRAVDWSCWWDAGLAARRTTVRNARLVCRLFCALASPLMFPVLRLRASRASLDLADAISRAPRIAAGVRGIVVSLETWSKDEAENIVRFAEARLDDLQGLLRLSARRDLTVEQRGKALWSMSWLVAEWRVHARAVEAGKVASGGEALSTRQEALREGFGEFCRLQKEQHQILTDGSFVGTLGSAVARMGSVGSFLFVDKLPAEEFGDPPGDPMLLSDIRKLSRFVSKPFGWRELGREEEWAANSVCERLLWELPIALDKAGASPRELKLGVIPHSRDFSMLGQRGADEPGPTTWDELSAACQQLEVLEFSGGARYEGFPEEDLANLDNYLASVLSGCGQHLRLLDLNFHQYVSTFFATGLLSYNADPVIGALPQELPCLQTLKLHRVEVGQAELEALCSRIGDRLGHLDLSGVLLHRGGCWAGAVDILRQKITTSQVVERRVHLGNLYGGEFGNGKAGLILLGETAMYVRGGRKRNPLRT